MEGLEESIREQTKVEDIMTIIERKRGCGQDTLCDKQIINGLLE